MNPHTTKIYCDCCKYSHSITNNVSRQIAPTDPAVVTVGSIHGGTKHNVIPNEVKLQSLRSYTDEVKNQTLSSIERIVRGSAISAGLTEEYFSVIEIKDEYTPAVFNNPSLVEKVQRSFVNTLGDEKVIEVSPVMGGKTLACLGSGTNYTYCFFWLGAVNNEVYRKSKKR